MVAASALSAFGDTAANTVIVAPTLVDYSFGSGRILQQAEALAVVNLVACAPSLSRPPDQRTAYSGPEALHSYAYELTGCANGPDFYFVTPRIADQANNQGDGASVASLSEVVLGGSVVLDGSSPIQLRFPSDGVADGEVNGIAPGDAVVVNGELRTVLSISDPADGHATIELAEALSRAPGRHDRVHERVPFTLALASGTVDTAGTDLTIDVLVEARNSGGSGADAVTSTFTSGSGMLVKYVRNVSSEGGNVHGTGAIDVVADGEQATYFAGGVTGSPGDILEYALVIDNDGSGGLTGGLLDDTLPAAQVEFSAEAYGPSRDVRFIGAGGQVSYFSAAADGDPATVADDHVNIDIDSALSSEAGRIEPGERVVVTFSARLGDLDHADVARNSADLAFHGGSDAAVVDAATVVRTDAVIELLRPTGADGEGGVLQETSCGGAPLPAPRRADGSPIPLPSSPSLAPASLFRVGDPVVVSVNDPDQDIDPLTAETVQVTISSTIGDDREELTLSETGPNTGVFSGYVQSVPPVSPRGDCRIGGGVGASITVSYRDPADASDTDTSAAVFDPPSVVFDSQSGDPVDGVTVVLVDAVSGAEAEVFGDDGVSAFPAAVVTGATARDSSGVEYRFGPGQFRFPTVAPGQYRLEVVPASTHAFPSEVADGELQALPGAPYALSNASRGEPATVGHDGVMRADVPIDRVRATTLFVTKTASRDVVAVGDFVQYVIEVVNEEAEAAPSLIVTDVLPPGFRYRAGSGRLGGEAPIEPIVAADGRTLTFLPGDLQSGERVSLRYVVEVTAGASLGRAVNRASVDAMGLGAQGTATASVLVREELFRSKAFLHGRIVGGGCDDSGVPARGLAGVRVYLEDGSYADSDKDGRWHLEGVTPDTHVVQIDRTTLPEGARVVACGVHAERNRKPYARFVELQGGTLWRVDFHVEVPEPEAPTKGPHVPEGDVRAADGGAPRGRIGFLSHSDGQKLAGRIGAVRVRLPAKLRPRLTIDGEEVSSDRIGVIANEEEAETRVFGYIGVDLGGAGTRTLRIEGVGPFGNTRFDERISIVRTGSIARIRLVETDGNVADGRTPVRVKVEMLDAGGEIIDAGGELEVRSNRLRPHRPEHRRSPLEGAARPAVVSADGVVLFEPVGDAGIYRATLHYDEAVVEVETYVRPAPREWIMVGIAEGTLAHETLSGNMEAPGASGSGDHFGEDGRIAFFAKGSIRGEWLITAAYDSEGGVDRRLFGDIDPDSYYTLYGDASAQGYDAPSERNLYLRVERDRFYAMFGDHETGLDETELADYGRSVSGLKSEYYGETLRYNVFATETDQAFVRDELRGDGTSGLYRLSATDIVINSERVTIEVRDRFRPDVIVERRPQSRHTDYNIDYDAGTLFFKSPVPNRDADFNPVFIVVDYESFDAGNGVTAGGRASMLLDKAGSEAGVSLVRDGTVGADGYLAATDLTLVLGEDTTLEMEAARSDRLVEGSQREGEAYLAELRHDGDDVRGSVYARRQDPDFGVGQQRASESGFARYGGSIEADLDDSHRLRAEAYSQEALTSGARRDVAESRLIRDAETFSAHVGARVANDAGSGGGGRSQHLLAGATKDVLDDRVSLHAAAEVGVGGGEANEFPDRLIAGADAVITEDVTLTASQELTWGEAQDTSTTSVGLKSTPWGGAELATGVSRDLTENGARTYANLGLLQRWKLGDAWSFDFGIDRSQTIGSVPTTLDTALPPVSGTRNDDFTALSLGAGFADDVHDWVGRVERRYGDQEDKWNLFSGYYRKLHDDLAISASASVNDADQATARLVSADLRGGLVYRSADDRWTILERLDLRLDDQDGAGREHLSRRIVNNLNANYTPSDDLQIALQYGAKYVTDTIDGERYSGYTDLLGGELRRNLAGGWDVGLRAGVLRSVAGDVMDHSYGVSLGYLIQGGDAWVSLGYNFAGFRDEDFTGSEYTSKGVYLRFRLKFDQETARKVWARWAD